MIVSLTKLRQLVTVAHCESLTRAAEELNISQPALSRTVAFIEEVYGVKIFDRTPQGVQPTRAGIAIVAEAEQLLRTANTFDHNANLIGEGQIGEVAFGMGPIIANILMAHVGIALLSGERMISFCGQIRHADYLIRALLADDLELGLVGNADLEIPDEIDVHPIGTLHVAVIARTGHPLADTKGVTIDQLRAYPLASPMDLNMRPAFRPVTHGIICDDYAAMKDMVRATDTLCLCSKIFARKSTEAGEVVTLDVLLPPSEQAFDIIAITPKGRTISPSVRLIIDCCRELLDDSG